MNVLVFLPKRCRKARTGGRNCPDVDLINKVYLVKHDAANKASFLRIKVRDTYLEESPVEKGWETDLEIKG